MTIAVLIVALAVISIAVSAVLLLRARRNALALATSAVLRPSPVRAIVDEAVPPVRAVTMIAQPLTSIERVPEPPTITWANGFDSRAGALDETARLRLIGDLGVVAKEWCVPLLSEAYLQEQRSGHREAALNALAACHSSATIPIFERASLSDYPAEIAIAVDALGELRPEEPFQQRHTAERY